MDNLKKNVYDAALITAGATAVGFVSRKAVGTRLSTPDTLKEMVKMGVAVGLGCFAVKYAQEKKWIPDKV